MTILYNNLKYFLDILEPIWHCEVLKSLSLPLHKYNSEHVKTEKFRANFLKNTFLEDKFGSRIMPIS